MAPIEQDQSLTRAFYDRIASAYDAIADADEHTARERGLELLAAAPGERVLEVGYGTGHSLAALAGAVGAQGTICGIDISDGMHDVAQRRIAAAGIRSPVELKVGAVPPLPYADASFDAVSMSFTLELFPSASIPEVLAEVRRVLRSGGRLGVVAMATVEEGARESILEKTYKWMHQHFPHIVDCQPIPARQLLEEAGFEISRGERLEIWTMPVAVLVGTP
jgi:ubiquinone/menaquinone biosynthesis C-methylase UbiE